MSERYLKVRQELQATVLGCPELTSREVAQMAGVDLMEAWRFWRALGFPRVAADSKFFSHRDVAILKEGLSLLEREDIDNEVLLSITRVHGQAFARMAAVQAGVLRNIVAQAMSDEAITDGAAVDEVVAAAEGLLTEGGPFLNYAWRRHLVAALVSLATPDSSELAPSVELTVGFADLVGFTEVSQNLSRRETAAILERFETLAYELIPENRGRVVKMIGDEVMFTAPEAEAALEISLCLVEACEADALVPAVRVGVAKGPTLAWQADVYGPAANLASRLVNLARPGSVLASPSVAEAVAGEAPDAAPEDDAAPPRFLLRTLSRHKLKGIGEVRPILVRRPR
jgi:adenylate cyclase